MVGSYFGCENYHGPQYSKYKAVLLRPTAHLKIVPRAPQAITIFISLISLGKSPSVEWFFDLVITSGSGFPQKIKNSTNSPVPGFLDTFRRKITTGTGSRFLNIFKEPTTDCQSRVGSLIGSLICLRTTGPGENRFFDWFFCMGNSQLGIPILHPLSFTLRFFLRWITNQDWFIHIECMHDWIWNGCNLMTQCMPVLNRSPNKAHVNGSHCWQTILYVVPMGIAKY